MICNPNLEVEGRKIWQLLTFTVIVANDVPLCHKLVMLSKCPIVLGVSDCPIVLGASDDVEMSHYAKNRWLSHCVESQ